MADPLRALECQPRISAHSGENLASLRRYVQTCDVRSQLPDTNMKVPQKPYASVNESSRRSTKKISTLQGTERPKPPPTDKNKAERKQIAEEVACTARKPHVQMAHLGTLSWATGKSMYIRIGFGHACKTASKVPQKPSAPMK